MARKSIESTMPVARCSLMKGMADAVKGTASGQ